MLTWELCGSSVKQDGNSSQERTSVFCLMGSNTSNQLLERSQCVQVPACEDFKKAGGTIYVPTPSEKAAFKAAAAPVYDWYLNKFGVEWLFKLENAVAQCNASVTDKFLTATQPKFRD